MTWIASSRTPATMAALQLAAVGLTPVFLYPLASFETKAAGFDSGLIEAPASKTSGEYVAKATAVPM